MTIQEILAIPQDQQKIPLTARIDSIVPHAKGHTVQLTDATGTLPKVLIWTSKFAEAPSLNMVPVGTQGEFSLTKKAYNGQWDYNGYLMKVAGIQNVSAPQPTAPAPAPAPAPADNRDDSVVTGQVRMHLACAAIQSGQALCTNPNDVLWWQEFVMTGKFVAQNNAPENMSMQQQRNQGCSDPAPVPNGQIPF